ncbi:enhanced serine sensitivity protein SseB C-terminal domain-containing protein [Lacticaseibacillus daqingensis]|uniref:enhanced serine sensitivity protein SseB C-terminal domain-containing protein n=1 Tax=Lacticaseibacillus daqingensis TaxID=2486014 RepID=UPI000F7B8C66|nr:enhanced serine sensitivity protein SseB C-terminal domain-containing protein [Lacticaseibacillus daqingensis]
MGLFGAKEPAKQTPAADQAAVHAITNDDLLAKWRTFSLDQSQEAMSAFLEELIEHSTLLMVVLADDGVDVAQADNDDLQFPLLTTTDDLHVQPLFTDWLAVNELYDNWNEGGLSANVARAHALPVGFLDMAHLIADNDDVAGIVVNPFSDNINLQRDVLADLAQQADARHAEQNEVQIAVSDPENLPEGLWAALEHELADHLVIRRAWLRLMHYDGQEHLILVVDAPDADDATKQRLADRLSQVGEAQLKDNPALGLSIAPLDDDSKALVEDITTTYEA